MHFVDKNFTQQVFEVVSEAQTECKAITTKVWCQQTLLSLQQGRQPWASLSIARGMLYLIEWIMSDPFQRRMWEVNAIASLYGLIKAATITSKSIQGR
jgi:hypothetical protein